MIWCFNQGPLNGGVSNGGVSRSGLVLPLLSFFVLFGTFPISFRDFPDLSGDSSGIFPICPFPLSRPINSAYEEQSRKGLRHNLDRSWKSGKPKQRIIRSLPKIRKASDTLNFLRHVMRAFCLSDQSALMDASPLWNLCKSSSTQPKTQPSKPPWVGIVQKVFSEKASAIAGMRQKCVRMRQNCVLLYWEKRNVQNASEIRQNCVKNASEISAEHLWGRTPFGRYRMRTKWFKHIAI